MLDFFEQEVPCPPVCVRLYLVDNTTNITNNNLKYYTVMKDRIWDENKIRQFFSDENS